MSAQSNSPQDPMGDFSAKPEHTPEVLSDQFEHIDQLARAYADDFEQLDDEPHSISLEDLSSSYAASLQRQAGNEHLSTGQPVDDEIEIFDPLEEQLHNVPQVPISPIAIVEAVLMVGRPDGGPISATEIATLMRGVSEIEVDHLVKQLNADYVAQNRALCIATVAGAYRMQLADELANIHERFLGPAREIRLNQAAIDCLALVAYQPGITREQLDKQRGQSSGPILNQLVRRELLEMRRERDGKKLQPHYYPTPRMLGLAGLESLEDLPTVEDWEG
jgi:segregation and condensation protein B